MILQGGWNAGTIAVLELRHCSSVIGSLPLRNREGAATGVYDLERQIFCHLGFGSSKFLRFNQRSQLPHSGFLRFRLCLNRPSVPVPEIL
jgi:hypothetical protein